MFNRLVKKSSVGAGPGMIVNFKRTVSWFKILTCAKLIGLNLTL